MANGFARACPWPGMNNLSAPCKFGSELSTRIFDEKQKLLVGVKEKVAAVMLLSSRQTSLEEIYITVFNSLLFIP
ncbi:hypothetical protein CDAR_85931 [Caerostris darwini]|uniref:Uncharacterized protein n=1 Tax=Caerostris darwini TaxID=1538125 RepID=A0AAV4N739_9ARAC|nr:hypothetical protein CDAR_85931 [Caerostris darwini]